MYAIKIAIAGLGTVGCGVIQLLNDNKEIIQKRIGREIHIVGVSARDRSKNRDVFIADHLWCNTPDDLLNSEADIIIELMGGADGAALRLASQTLSQGKKLITANKAMLAKHGVALAELSEQKSAPIYFEAAVAGGLPIIKVLREGLAANNINSLLGILNGTCNYILTTMLKFERSFDDVLSEAQKKGYAEADPTLDIDGWDTAHKLCLLNALSFGCVPNMDSICVSGIRDISLKDLQTAQNKNGAIKLIGRAEKNKSGEIVQTVSPEFVSFDVPLAHVPDAFNAVYLETSHAGPCFIQGRGAGAQATASAVVADIIDAARGIHTPFFGLPTAQLLRS